ncbi:MAG: hypothetical protein KTR18_15340 [Acidiferrobacterales bacterium]|nr:hypothetical protein [Acidiferrobacterales bacterium]
MKRSTKDFFYRKPQLCGKRTITACFVYLLSLTWMPAISLGGNNRVCSHTASSLYIACIGDQINHFYTAKAGCLNLEDKFEQRQCLYAISRSNHEDRKECRSIRYARMDLCDEIGEQAYTPKFGPKYAEHFVDPREIGVSIQPNIYLPLIVGNQWNYQSVIVDESGEPVTESIRVEVTDRTKEIDGITCVVVKDIVDEDGAVIEDTSDWYAQDIEGNVWYCGEISKNYESFDGDEPQAIELTDIDGSWKAGRDFAKAGVLFPAVPEVGQIIRQEVAWREAEDVIEVLSLTGSEAAPGGSCENNCLVTRDFTPLDPGVDEIKYFAPGVGLILEIDADGNRVELVRFTSSR